MQTQIHAGSKVIMMDIPYSRMKYPDSFLQKIKYFFWYIYTPVHPYGRDIFLKLGIVRHKGRQEFLLGKIDIEKSLEPMVKALIAHGYGNHFVAWEDAGEVISLRYSDDFQHQYHIRIFSDGEVRAHYEYTPECHPVWHMKEIGVESRSEVFTKIIGIYLLG